ncbi:hypothetical protein ACFL6I_27955, partial [candidate division KSB1 bacterium]
TEIIDAHTEPYKTLVSRKKSKKKSEINVLKTAQISDVNKNSISQNTILFSDIPKPIKPKELSGRLFEFGNKDIYLKVLPEYKYHIKSKWQRRQHNSSLSIDLTVGGSIINNNLESQPGYDTHISIRQNNEDNILTPSYNLNFRYTKGRVSVITGLNYCSYGEKTNYSIFHQQYDTISFLLKINDIYWEYDTITFYQDPNNPGVWFPILSPQSHDTTYSIWTEKDTVRSSERKYENRNIYSYVEIPVLIGYNWYYKRFGFELAGGISFGFLSKSSGYVLDLNNLSVVENSSSELPLNKTNLNYLLVGNITYIMRKRLSLLIQLHYKQQISSLYTSDHPVEQKYNTYNINAGIRYIIK